ncbi:MAG: sugar ABC transporter ATP-binding protein, partial [Mesorhizobium sp.]
ADRSEVKSADDLINFMEEIAHPGGLPGLHEAGGAEQRA